MDIAAGATSGGIAGRQGGAALEQAVAPGQSAEFEQQGSVPLSAMDEAQRGQELMASLQIARRSENLQQYAQPLTEAFLQSRANLQKIG